MLLVSSPEEKGMILSTLDMVHLICLTKGCSGSTRHLSCLFCRIILAPSVIRIILLLPDISLAAYKSLASTLHILLFKNIFLHPGCAIISQISIFPSVSMRWLDIYVYQCYKFLLVFLQCYKIFIISHRSPCFSVLMSGFKTTMFIISYCVPYFMAATGFCFG